MIIVAPVQPAAEVATTYVPLTPQNVVHLGAPLHAEILAALRVCALHSCSNNISLKTVLRFSVRS